METIFQFQVLKLCLCSKALLRAPLACLCILKNVVTSLKSLRIVFDQILYSRVKILNVTFWTLETETPNQSEFINYQRRVRLFRDPPFTCIMCPVWIQILIRISIKYTKVKLFVFTLYCHTSPTENHNSLWHEWLDIIAHSRQQKPIICCANPNNNTSY